MLSVPETTAAENKSIGATIRIGQEIWFLPYERFFVVKFFLLFFTTFRRVENNLFNIDRFYHKT